MLRTVSEIFSCIDACAPRWGYTLYVRSSPGCLLCVGEEAEIVK